MTCLRRVPYLVWLLLGFLGSRLLYLFLIHPDHFFILSEDELYKGVIAKELASGRSLPLIEYRANNYSGGSLVVGAIASGFFRLFGPTVFALKLAPLLFFSLALVFWYLTLRRHVCNQVASYFALLFILSPPLFTSYSLTAMGGHGESLFFTALTLFLFFRLLSSDNGRRVGPVLLGLTAGFGLCVSYIYALTLVTVLVLWLWSEDQRRLTKRLVSFGLAFVVGFLPWIVFNFQNRLAGTVIHSVALWDHFRLTHLVSSLSDYRSLFPYQLFGTFASDDPADPLQLAINLLYTALVLVPMLAAGSMGLRGVRSNLPPPGSDRNRVLAFGLVYLCLFTLAVQLSDFKAPRYNIPVYPFLFFLVAYSLTGLERAFPSVRNRLRRVFLTCLFLLAVVGHSALFSLAGSGMAFSTKGYSYGSVPEFYFCRDELKACDEQVLRQIDQSPFVSTILPTLTPEDQREFWIATIPMLAAGVSGHSLKGEVPRIEGVIPRAFLKHFFYWLGISVISSNPNDLPKAVSSVDFLRFRSAAWHQLTLTGIYAAWPEVAPLVASPESLLGAPVRVAPEIAPLYWTGLGQYAGRYWFKTDFSLQHLHAQLDKVLPRLDPSTQRYVLQGIGRFLFRKWTGYPIIPPALVPSQLERLPRAYHQGLFEGAGMALAEIALHSWSPSLNETSSLWRKATAGLSDASISSIRQGWKQFMDRLGDQTSPGVVGARCNAEAGEQPTRDAHER